MEQHCKHHLHLLTIKLLVPRQEIWAGHRKRIPQPLLTGLIHCGLFFFFFCFSLTCYLQHSQNIKTCIILFTGLGIKHNTKPSLWHGVPHSSWQVKGTPVAVLQARCKRKADPKPKKLCKKESTHKPEHRESKTKKTVLDRHQICFQWQLEDCQISGLWGKRELWG